MRKIKLDQFEICVMKEGRSKLEFAAVAPTKFSDISPENMQRKIMAYLNFHLAIKPNNTVVLFQINELAEVGSPVYTLPGGKKLYHIPLSLYPQLDEIVEEDIFIVTSDLLTRVIEKGHVYKSIFECLTEEHHTNGLVVIGMHGEDSENQES